MGAWEEPGSRAVRKASGPGMPKLGYRMERNLVVGEDRGGVHGAAAHRGTEAV